MLAVSIRNNTDKSKFLMLVSVVLLFVLSLGISATMPDQAYAGTWKKNSVGWWYKNDDGTYPKSTWQEIDDVRYKFNNKGYMQTGWIKDGGKWYYAKKSGALATGWVKSGKKWYYLNPEGVMQTSWVQPDKKTWYYLNSSGAMVTGWKKLGGKWYYLSSSGAMQTGWLKDADKWYFLRDTGEMATGWLDNAGMRYYLAGSGVMQTGWKQLNKQWYYFENSGAAARNKWVGWYYLGNDCAMLVNTTTPDGYKVDSSGKAQIPSNVTKLGYQNPSNLYQVSCRNVVLPKAAYKTDFCYVTPSRIGPFATREECVEAMIGRATEYLGTGYKWGYALAPGVGVDCSGLVIQALYACGMEMRYNPYVHMYDESLTPTTNFMLNDPKFKKVALKDRKRGDLIFYGSNGKASHVGIYLGNDEIINATPPKVQYDSLWRWNVVGVVRPFV